MRNSTVLLFTIFVLLTILELMVSTSAFAVTKDQFYFQEQITENDKQVIRLTNWEVKNLGSFDLPLYYEVAVYQYSIYNSNPDKSKLLECGDSRVLGFESEAGIKHTEKSEIVEKLVNDVTTNAELGYSFSGIGGGISWTEQITKTNELYLTKSLGYFESHKYIDKSVINNPTNWDTWVSIMDIVNIIQYLPITNPDLIILISQMNGYAKDVIHNQGLVNETQKEINKINAELDAEKEKWDVLGSHAEAEKNANKLLKPLNTKMTPFTTNLKVSQDILDRTISEINKIVEAENSNERTQYSYGLQNLGKEVSLETILDMPNEISRTEIIVGFSSTKLYDKPEFCAGADNTSRTYSSSSQDWVE